MSGEFRVVEVSFHCSFGFSEHFFLFLLHFSNQPAPLPLSWSLQERVMEHWQEGWGVGKVNLSALDTRAHTHTHTHTLKHTHTHTHTHKHTPILRTVDRVPASFWWLWGMRPIGKSNPCRSCTILHPYAGWWPQTVVWVEIPGTRCLILCCNGDGIMRQDGLCTVMVTESCVKTVGVL